MGELQADNVPSEPIPPHPMLTPEQEGQVKEITSDEFAKGVRRVQAKRLP